MDVAIIHELKRDLGAWHRMSWQTRDVIVRMLGEAWLEDYLARANAGGIERVLV